MTTLDRLVLGSPRLQTPVLDPPYQTWVLSNGNIWTEFYRTATGYLLRFPNLADFKVSLNGEKVACFPAPDVFDVASYLIQHLYINQVLPLALSKQGELVFHASAVEIDQIAVAFVAESRRGKSTLAASFATNGFRFITDDGLVVKSGASGFEIVPSHPSLRLREDSQSVLVSPAVTRDPTFDHSSKVQYLAGGDLAFCEKPRPIRRMYFLGDGKVTSVEITRLTAAETSIELIRHAFLLDPEDRQGLARHFDHAVKLANQGFHYRLDYPRKFDELAQVRQAIITHALQES